MAEKLVGATGLTKRFGATVALDAVDFDLYSGEIHALVGENGAGKSTLIRILSGVLRADEGALQVGGTPRRFANPRDAITAGIATIPQELRLVPVLSVAENIALGDLPVRHGWGKVATVDHGRMREESRALLARLGFAPDPDARVDTLAFAERQLVAIAKALRRNCRILILDEPTAALEAREVERLFAVLARMRSDGVGIVYISHRLAEVTRIADRCTVLRDGRVVAARARDEIDAAGLVRAMTGRDIAPVQEAEPETGEPLLEEMDMGEDAIAVPAGAIVGMAGLLGSGAAQRTMRLFGALHAVRLRVGGRATAIGRPRAAVAAGMGLVPGERKLGLVMNQSVRDNILLPSLDGWRIDRRAGDRLVAELMDLLDIRPRRPDLPASSLSGGNQQKVIFAKWLAKRAGILLLDDATQSVDAAAKAQIHGLIRKFVQEGGGVLMRSSDLAELSQLCRRVYAMRHGAITARLEGERGIDENALRQAIGG